MDAERTVSFGCAISWEWYIDSDKLDSEFHSWLDISTIDGCIEPIVDIRALCSSLWSRIYTGLAHISGDSWVESRRSYGLVGTWMGSPVVPLF